MNFNYFWWVWLIGGVYFQVFNADNSFNNRNKLRRTSAVQWAEKLGDDGVFAISPAANTRKVNLKTDHTHLINFKSLGS